MRVIGNKVKKMVKGSYLFGIRKIIMMEIGRMTKGME